MERGIVAEQEEVGWEHLFVGRAVRGGSKILTMGRSKCLYAGKIGWALGKSRWSIRNDTMHEGKQWRKEKGANECGKT